MAPAAPELPEEAITWPVRRRAAERRGHEKSRTGHEDAAPAEQGHRAPAQQQEAAEREHTRSPPLQARRQGKWRLF